MDMEINEHDVISGNEQSDRAQINNNESTPNKTESDDFRSQDHPPPSAAEDQLPPSAAEDHPPPSPAEDHPPPSPAEDHPPPSPAEDHPPPSPAEDHPPPSPAEDHPPPSPAEDHPPPSPAEDHPPPSPAEDHPPPSPAEDLYSKLMELEQWALVPNMEVFTCGVCLEECKAYDGVILRECLHSFCRDCLASAIKYCEDPNIVCASIGCSENLQEREIRNLVSVEEYESWLARSLNAAERSAQRAFHCRTRDCIGWAFIDADVENFVCPVCQSVSCISCLAIHEGESCQQHLLRVLDPTDGGTQVLLENLIASGEAMACPTCKVVISKEIGCDWLQCSSCKTEICWVTRGPRWGPNGKGDTTGGCRCNYGRKKCHPNCNNCH